MSHPDGNGVCSFALVHLSTHVCTWSVNAWVLGIQMQDHSCGHLTTYPVTAYLCAVPASKLCLYHLGLSWYTCVTRPQSLEASECPESLSRWQETLPGPASSLGPQNDPPLHPSPGPACKDTASAWCPGLLGCRQSTQRRLAHPNSVTAAALAPSPLPCTQCCPDCLLSLLSIKGNWDLTLRDRSGERAPFKSHHTESPQLGPDLAKFSS